MLEKNYLKFMLFFERKKAWGVLKYILFFAIIAILVAVVVNSLPCIDDGKNENAFEISYVLAGILFAPIAETVLFQAIPFLVLRRLKFSVSGLQLIAMSVPFALAHSSHGYYAVICTFLVGLIFAASFITWAQKSIRDAMIVTSSIHALYNLALCVLHILFDT